MINVIEKIIQYEELPNNQSCSIKKKKIGCHLEELSSVQRESPEKALPAYWGGCPLCVRVFMLIFYLL